MPQMHDAASFLALRDAGLPLLDVRSPGEYAHGHIPGAVNMPVFSDDERAAVGTAHARSGHDAAVHVGLTLLGPQLAAKLSRALHLAGRGPRREVLIHCWRGGLRSASMAWLLELGGFTVHLLQGGYKAYRALVRTTLGAPARVHVLGGMTGCGKTAMLDALRARGAQVVDLEALAGHRGSAFGGAGLGTQPSNESVDNAVHELWRHFDPALPIWLEDEGRRIGTVTLSAELFAHLEQGALFVVELPRELRLRRLVALYAEGVHDANADQPERADAVREALIAGFVRLRERLGSEACARCCNAVREGRFLEAADRVLDYYDKGYTWQLERRARLVRHRLCMEEDNPELAADRLLALAHAPLSAAIAFDV